MYLLKRAIDSQVSDLKQMLGLNEFSANDKDESNMSPLHYAAWYNKCEAVKMLINHKADVDARDNDGATPLHYAARYKQRFLLTDTEEQQKEHSTKEVIRLLEEAGADVNDRDIYGDTPLFFAVLRGNVSAVEELLACKGIDVDAPDKRKWCSLHVAAKYSRLEIAEMLIKAGASIRARTDRAVTPMHVACMEGDLAFIKLLLKYYKEKEKQLFDDENVEQESPLDLAVEHRKTEVVKLCLEYGARVRKTCRKSKVSPLHIAASAGDVVIAKLLLEKDKHLVFTRNDQRATALHKAAEYNRADVATLLLDWESNMEAQDIDGDTPLLTAVEYGSSASTKVLLEHGANVKACDNNDQTVLHIAAKYNEIKTMEILLEFLKKTSQISSLVSADDRVGDGPLHLAARNGHFKIVKLLVKYGADLKDKNEDEEIPLHVAAEKGFPEIVTVLLQSSPDSSTINDLDEDTNTPLHLACSEGHVDVVNKLLQAGAVISHRNRLFWTPLACAVDGGHADVVKVLLEMGAEIDPLDRHFSTPLHLASKKGHAGVAKILIEHRAKVDSLDDAGNNPLDIAIKYGQEEVAMVIVESDNWRNALQNRTPGRSHFENNSTPLRKLIRKMPDVAERVFDRCISYPSDVDLKDPALEIEFDFQFIDDTYSASCWGDSKFVKTKNTRGRVYNKLGHVYKDAQPYTSNPVARIENHPLNIMVDANKGDLLYHPLVLALVRQKWKLAQISYFSFLIFYLTFVISLTTFLVLSKPPYFYNSTIVANLNISRCEDAILADMSPDHGDINLYYMGFSAILIWVLCGFGMAIEVMQIYNTPWSYCTTGTNILDWFTYIAGSLVVAPIGRCYIRTDWQWQLGTMCMFIAWLDLILFLRRLPGVGIYIVMVGEVFVTFIKFFVFCFSLFIFAFGFTFYLLLRNQEPFGTPSHSFAKTVVMMVGEMDFGDIFHGGEDFDTVVAYESLTYIIFILFISMCTIVIMNLLTGLAVGDVQVIQDQAKVKKLAMQIELAMDVEMSLMESLRKRLRCTVERCKMKPNQMAIKWVHKIGKYFNGPLSSQRIAAVIFKDMEKQMEQDFLLVGNDDDQKANSGMKKQIMTQLKSQQAKLDDLTNRMGNIEHMLTQLLQSQNIRLADEEGTESSA